MKTKIQPQVNPKELVQSLIRNHYNRIKAAEELGVEVNVFETQKYIDYVKASTTSISKTDIVQMIVNDLNELDRTTRDYHKTKQKYYDQLISLAVEVTEGGEYEFEV